MSIVYSQITLDVLKLGTQATVNAKTGDANSRGVEITLVKGGEPFKIPDNASAKLRAQPNGATVYNYCTIEDNKLYYIFTTDDVAAPGSWLCELQIVGAGAASSLYSPCFTLLVESTLYSDSEVESQDQFTGLTQAITATNNLNITASKSGDTATVTVTHKDGTSNSVEITDGSDGQAAEISGASASATTLDPDEDATVSVTTGGTAQARSFAFSFGIPQGQKGDTGATGATGADGQAAEITSVSASATTLDPDDDATASVATGGTAQARSFAFSFGIPKGEKGDTGEPGADGQDGTDGQDGAAAGFGTVSATASAGESASASVETSGPDTAKNMAFSFVIPPVADGSVTTAKLADDAVTGVKIADGTIPNSKLADYAALPAGCRRLNFLRSTGTQYIDTGVVPQLVRTNGNTTSATYMMIRAAYTQSGGSGNAGYYAGAADALGLTNGTRNGILIGRASDNSTRAVYSNRVGVFDTGSAVGGTFSLAPTSTTIGYWCNGVLKDNQSTQLVNIENQNKTIYLFGVNYTTTPTLCDCVLIMEARLGHWDSQTSSNVIDHNYIPILDPYGRPCMYDIVAQEYKYNAGSGQFLWG